MQYIAKAELVIVMHCMLYSGTAMWFLDSSVISWSCTDEIAVALDTEVFKWNSTTGICTDVPLYTNRSESAREPGRPPLTVTAVAWDPQSKYLAIGFESSQLEVRP